MPLAHNKWRNYKNERGLVLLFEVVMGTLRYFVWAFFFTFVGLLLSAWLGWLEIGSFSGATQFLFICSVLAVLEISFSFDNSIVNARILDDMSEQWKHRFLTWGIVIAVFGMRIIFPLAVVAFAAWLDPLSALKLAIWEPQRYASIMEDAHVGISAFGGTFLLLVGLKYFFDAAKDVHWIGFIEVHAQKLSAIRGVEIIFALVLILTFSHWVHANDEHTFLIAALYGLLTFLLVEGFGALLNAQKSQVHAVYKGGFGTFAYLEVLDASFSFDGVVGAFALSKNLFIIAIGLGIGALYVRSMTIMLVEKRTLAQYRYLEHGAFYAVIILAIIMYLQTLMHVPEVVTGLIGLCLIVFAFMSSVRYNRRYCGDNRHISQNHDR